MSYYPPGTSANDPRAPWNADPEPTCPHCREEMGWDDDAQEYVCETDSCHMKGVTETELQEAAEEDAAERRAEMLRDCPPDPPGDVW